MNKIKDLIKNNWKKIIISLIFLILLFSLYSYTNSNNIEEQITKASENNNEVLVNIPFTDITLDLKNTSLFLAALVIGLLDGFNPCAMWVLIYLITLVSGLKNKAKMWFIVGTFLLASGILYFFILAGWLNLFAIIGYSQWIIFLVGAFAIWTGLYALHDFYKSGGKIECKVGDIKSRKKTMNKIKDIVHSPITIASVIATIALAFAVNSIEFVCSAGLPAMFTQLLAISDISVISQYLYILTYVFAFMFDDLLIFSLALFAINSPLIEKYSGLSKLIGGIIMIAIGIILLFFPGLLS